MQITGIWIIFYHFGPFWNQNPKFGGPVFGQFFSSKYRHVGCPERCHVMPGLSATFSNARDPLRGSKRPKSQFYGHYGPHIPIFGTSFSANLFSLQNIGMWGVQSVAMWCLVPIVVDGYHVIMHLKNTWWHLQAKTKTKKKTITNTNTNVIMSTMRLCIWETPDDISKPGKELLFPRSQSCVRYAANKRD